MGSDYATPTHMPNTNFTERVLNWFDQHGRKNLPWQHNISPYRVWVSEIMLQQTQVSTVIPYFERFMESFPTVESLATAKADEVLHHWTGLGYYARARNLHKAAKVVVADFDGVFPDSVEALSELPGIGRSTAGAIRSIAFGLPAAILDGNVKRVLARHAAIDGWPGQSGVAKELWALAENHTPDQRCGDYSQAMMDLGATLCTRSAPDCEHCPVMVDCQAQQQGNPLDYPGKKPKKALPVRQTTLVMALVGEEVLLEKRPGTGIWGGLWCFPEAVGEKDAADWIARQLHTAPPELERWQSFRHTFSHYHLDITPILARLPCAPEAVMEADARLWYNIRRPPQVGLAAPVARLLQQLAPKIA